MIQFKENLNAFAAVHGQCRKICVEGVERFVLVECGEPSTPNPDERKGTINDVLTAVVRGEFGVTNGMEPSFNTRCYRAAGGQCVHPFRVEISEPAVEVARPVDGTEVTDKAAAAAALALQIEKSRQVPGSCGLNQAVVPTSARVWRNSSKRCNWTTRGIMLTGGSGACGTPTGSRSSGSSVGRAFNSGIKKARRTNTTSAT